MTRPTHYGRPDTDVIPDDWESRLAPVAKKTQTATCEIRGPSTKGVADEGTGVRSTVAGPLRYTGTCRILRRDQIAEGVDLAEETRQAARYLIAVDTGVATVQPRDALTVTASTDARLPVGSFIVREVVEGSLRWERLLWCTRNS